MKGLCTSSSQSFKFVCLNTQVEFQLGASLVSGALIYAYRSSTCDAAVASATFFAQLFVLTMAALLGGVSALFALFCIFSFRH